MATEATSAKDVREKLVDEMAAKAEEINKGRSGKGTRLKVGQTRGKNPQVIQFEVFDESQPETLPATLKEFMEVSKVKDEKVILSLLITGFNQDAYTTASDPIAEFINPAWPEDVQKNFRTVVRNYSAGANVSLEDAVALIKPGIEKALTK